jgi:hypothetical protein
MRELISTDWTLLQIEAVLSGQHAVAATSRIGAYPAGQVRDFAALSVQAFARRRAGKRPPGWPSFRVFGFPKLESNLERHCRDRLTIQREVTRCVVRAVGRPSVRRGLARLGRALLFPFQILTRKLEGSPQCHEHRFSGCDGSLRITVRLHPRYQIDLFGHPPFAFGDMDLSL